MSNVWLCSYGLADMVPSASIVERKTTSSHSLIDLRDGVLARANDSRIGMSDELGSMRHVEGRPSRPARPTSWL